MREEIKIFGLGPTRDIAINVCKELGINLSVLKEEIFPDGELKVCPNESVENRDVFVFHSLGGNNVRSVNDRLCELYFILSALRDHGASKVTAITPYLSYARSDQRKGAFDSINLRYVAKMLEGSGVDRIISLDVHNISAFENAFRIPSLNLEATNLFCQYLAPGISKTSQIVVLSPDIGGIKRAEKFRKELEAIVGIQVDSAFLEKFRTEEGITGNKLTGTVKGRAIIIIDDMISTGETILHAIKACHSEGAGSIKVCATHGLFTKNQNELLNSPLVDEFIVTNSHPALSDLTHFNKLKILSCAQLFSALLAEKVIKWVH